MHGRRPLSDLGLSTPARRYLARDSQSGMPIVELRDVTLWAHGRRLAQLARALAKSPRLLVLEEPCQGLDGPHRDRVLSILDELCKHRTSTEVLVTHDPREIPRSVERVPSRAGYEHGWPV